MIIIISEDFFKEYEDDEDEFQTNIPEHINSDFLKSLTPLLLKAAQKQYDEWEQNEDGYCDWMGYGGICQEIAGAFCDVLYKHDIECTTFSQQIGEQHVFAIAQVHNGVYEIDIPPYVYEKGGGYCWKKIPGVVFTDRDLIIKVISYNPNDYQEYLEEN